MGCLPHRRVGYRVGQREGETSVSSKENGAPSGLILWETARGAEEAASEEARLEVLDRYGVLGTPPEPAFDRLTSLAARLLKVPMAFLNFIGSDHQWTKSVCARGWDIEVPSRVDREISFCSHWMDSGDDVVEVPDARLDARFAHSSFVTEGGLRFYAGALLRSPEGRALGTLCVIGREPRRLSEDERDTLRELAQVVMDEMEFRASVRAWGHDVLREGKAQGAARSEAMWRAMIENGSDIISLVDHDGRFLYQSPSVQRVLGFAPEEFVGTFGYEWLHPDDRAAMVEAAIHASGKRFTFAPEAEANLAAPTDSDAPLRLPAGTPAVEEVEGGVRTFYRHRHADGAWRIMEAVGRPMPEGSGVQGIIVNSRDISQRYRDEEELALSEERHKSLIEHHADAIAVLCAEGKYLHVNPAFEAMTGFSVPDVLGRRFGFSMPEDQRSQAHAAFEKTLDGQPHRFELALRRADNSPIELAVTAVPIVARGQNVGVYIISRDITPAKQAEAELRAAKLEAERANRAKSEFLSRMSHELRTPLNAILGFGQLLEMARLPAREAGGVEQITKAGRHLLDLINEVLDISRIETGSLELHMELVPIRAALREAASLVAPLADGRSISLREARPEARAEADAEELWAWADRQRLRQVLLNLFSNAVKYNRDGGWVEYEASARCAELELRVSDGGRGIPADKLPRLFTPFERLGADSSGIEGIGLGLSVSKRLAEAMNGTIEAHSVAEQGTTFTLRLPPPCAVCHGHSAPVKHAAAQDAPQVLAALGEAGAGRLVLYIEDNVANALLMEHIVEGLPGLRLLIAETAAQGTEAASREHPATILLDLNLPDAHGLSIVPELRRACPHACIAIVSADATPEQIERAHAMGLKRYFAKPLDVGALSEFLSADC